MAALNYRGQPISSTQVVLSPIPAANATQGSATSIALLASGGTAPYTFSTTALPAGLTLSGSTISGTPTATGSTTITAKVTDSSTPTPTTASQTFTLTVSALGLVPAAPTQLQIVVGSSSAILSWVNTSGATGVDIYQNGVSIFAGALISTYTVSGLAPGTYTFTVADSNQYGISAQSAGAIAVIATPATVPGAPTIGTATPANASATLTWTAPASNGGSSITGYLITPSSGATQTVGNITTGTITGLTNGTTYTFTVAAINVAGTGPQSAASNSIVVGPVATVPAAPTNLTASVSGSTVTLNWVNSSGTQGDDIYQNGTQIAYPGIGDGGAGVTVTTYTVSNLAAGTYAFTVAGYNAAGVGPQCAPVNVTISAGSAPSGYSLTEYTAGPDTSMPAWLSDWAANTVGYPVQFCTGYFTQGPNPTDQPIDIGSSQALLNAFSIATFPIGVWGVPMLPGGYGVSNWGAWSSGQYTANFVQIAQYMVSIGRGADIWRLGWEFNGGWYTWAANGYASQFIQAWQEIHTAVKAVAPNMRFCWNTTLGDQYIGDLAGYYPGDAYVDYVAADWYDNSASSSWPGQPANWNAQLAEAYGGDWLSNFATAHGKGIMIPEFGSGLDTGAASNGGDDPAFIGYISAWMKANHCYEAGYWNSGNDAGTVPNMVAALTTYLSNFALG